MKGHPHARRPSTIENLHFRHPCNTVRFVSYGRTINHNECRALPSCFYKEDTSEALRAQELKDIRLPTARVMIRFAANCE